MSALSGLRVVVTRSRTQASVLRVALERLGATVWEIPAIEFEDIAGWERDVFETGAAWDWTVVTSKNAAERLASAIRAGRGSHELLGRIAVSGSATARYLEKYGLSPQLVPDRFVAEAIVEKLVERGVSGQRILLPRALEARNVLVEELEAAGASVSVVPLYRAVLPTASRELLERASSEMPDLLTFASSKTARHFAELLQETGAQRWYEVPAAAIGPISAETASELGFHVVVTPEEHTIPALVDAIVDWRQRATP